MSDLQHRAVEMERRALQKRADEDGALLKRIADAFDEWHQTNTRAPSNALLDALFACRARMAKRHPPDFG